MFLHHLLLFMFMLVPLCSGHFGSPLATRDGTSRVYCGRTLARVIAELCSEVYSYDMRSHSGTMYGNLITPFHQELTSDNGWPWITATNARVMNSSLRKRIAGGITSECCDKPCNISELIQYC